MRLDIAEIERRMAEQELSQAALAERMGARRDGLCHALRRIRNGSDVTPKLAGAIARGLGVRVGDILDTSGIAR